MSTIHKIATAMGLITRAEPEDGGTPAGVRPPARGVVSASLAQALTLDSVFRAFLFLQTASMQLTLDVWRGRDMIDKPALVRKPDIDSNLSAFIAETVTSLAGRGNAYWKLTRGPSGQVANLEVLPALDVTAYKDMRTGRPRFDYKGKTYTRVDIQHLKLLRITGDVPGLGPIQAFRQGIAGALDQARYADTFFDVGGIPNSILKTDQNLTAATAEDARKQWMAARAKADHGPAVLGSGLDFRLLQLKPEELQWLESQKFTVTQIARLFGIPARHMLASIEGGSQTYTNQEQEDISFVRFTLMAYLREIEEAFTDLLPHGQTARFNVEGLLRTDTKTRMESHKIAIDSGILTPAEVREIEGYGPAPETPTPAPAPASKDITA